MDAGAVPGSPADTQGRHEKATGRRLRQNRVSAAGQLCGCRSDRQLAVRVFEYSYLDVGGRGVDEIEYSRVRRFSVCAVTLPRDRPLLEVHPESLGSRLAGHVKMTRNIDFESEDFNRAIVIRSPDRKFAYGHWISCRGSYSPQPRTLGSLSVTITRMSRALCSQTSAIAYRPCEAPIGCFTRAGR